MTDEKAQPQYLAVILEPGETRDYDYGWIEMPGRYVGPVVKLRLQNGPDTGEQIRVTIKNPDYPGGKWGDLLSVNFRRATKK
jgi:hypothetical protein